MTKVTDLNLLVPDLHTILMPDNAHIVFMPAKSTPEPVSRVGIAMGKLPMMYMNKPPADFELSDRAKCLFKIQNNIEVLLELAKLCPSLVRKGSKPTKGCFDYLWVTGLDPLFQEDNYDSLFRVGREIVRRTGTLFVICCTNITYVTRPEAITLIADKYYETCHMVPILPNVVMFECKNPRPKPEE